MCEWDNFRTRSAVGDARAQRARAATARRRNSHPRRCVPADPPTPSPMRAQAAAAIYARTLAVCGCDTLLTPTAVLAAAEPELRGAGLSARKARGGGMGWRGWGMAELCGSGTHAGCPPPGARWVQPPPPMRPCSFHFSTLLPPQVSYLQALAALWEQEGMSDEAITGRCSPQPPLLLSRCRALAAAAPCPRPPPPPPPAATGGDRSVPR